MNNTNKSNQRLKIIVLNKHEINLVSGGFTSLLLKIAPAAIPIIASVATSILHGKADIKAAERTQQHALKVTQITGFINVATVIYRVGYGRSDLDYYEIGFSIFSLFLVSVLALNV